MLKKWRKEEQGWLDFFAVKDAIDESPRQKKNTEKRNKESKVAN
jgi:hypothetical protein